MCVRGVALSLVEFVCAESCEEHTDTVDNDRHALGIVTPAGNVCDGVKSLFFRK